MNIPVISVIMSVYNGERHLVEALDSILAQSLCDFEFIVVDDASTDTTPEILASYVERDSRVRVLTNDTNMERSYSRNRAINASSAPLIAVMDADDWAHPERIAKQYAFMQACPEVAVCGAWLEVYETGDIMQLPRDNSGIRAYLLFNSAIAHPTAMFRKEPVLRLVGGYDATKPPAEDYDLWARLSAHDEVRFANLPEVLLRYRSHPAKERLQYYVAQRDSANATRAMLLRRLGIDPSEKDMLHHQILFGLIELSWSSLYSCWRWKQKILKYNERVGTYEQCALDHFLQGAWREVERVYSQYAFWHRQCAECAPDFARCWYRCLKQCLKKGKAR